MVDVLDETPGVRLGSDPARCDLVSDRKTVSGLHAQILRRHDTWMVEDLGSTNGTFVRGERIEPFDPVPVEFGDTISLGRSALFILGDYHVQKILEPEGFQPSLLFPPDAASPIPTPAGAAADARFMTAQLSAADVARMAAFRREISDGGVATPPSSAGLPVAPPAPGAPNISIGYAEENDIVIPNAVVSGRHARIYLDDGRYVIEDHGSTNGTFVGGRQVQRAVLSIGDCIALGSYQLTFDGELADRLQGRTDEDPERVRGALPFAPGREIVIGRGPGCDIVLDAPMVSAQHVTLKVLESGDAYRVHDHGSTNGSFLNSRENQITEDVTVTAAEVLFLGSYRLPLSRLEALVVDRSTAADSIASVQRGVFVVGRDPTVADIPLASPVVSARHAEIRVLDEGRFSVRDLGSANGTFVNGVRVRGQATARVGDQLSLGSYLVRLDPEAGVVRKGYHGDIMLQAERISIDVRDPQAPRRNKRILDDVSFTAYPTEFVGLMGPSGAGKTTLMMALNGYMPPSTGRSLINGLDLYESYNAFRGNIGYVPQDDIVYPQLTVYESLYYTARIRLPADTTREEIDRKISHVLDQLEIQHTRDVIIGDAVKKGISGGERKRVNLAQELITEPSLLFLDEPTSGLASEDTINVMRLLRALADTGKTILLTIHQPSLEAYRLMDTVIYLFRGSLVYYGPAYPDSILHFNEEAVSGPEREKLLADPGNALKPLARDQRRALDAPPAAQVARVASVVSSRRDAYERSRYFREYIHDRAEGTPDVELEKRSVDKTLRRGMLRQSGVLTKRTALIKWKDRVNTAILMVQAPVIGGILALVYAATMGSGSYFDSLARGPSALFLLVASAVWFGCSNSAREIVSEQAIYRRERMVNLTIRGYTLSKLAVLGLVCAAQCLVLLAIVYLPLQLEGSFLVMYGILLLTSLVGLGMGLTLSAVVASGEAAVALVPLILIPQIILGGVIMPIHELQPATRILSNLMAARWGYEAILYAEYGDDDLDRIRDECGIPECVWSTGATGFSFTYYSGDPDQATETETSGGLEALQGGQVPYVTPADQAICQAFCVSVQNAEEITPIDRSFGAEPLDRVRAEAFADIAVDGSAPDDWVRAGPHARTSLGTATGTLGAFLAFLVLLVMSILKYRDVEVG